MADEVPEETQAQRIARVVGQVIAVPLLLLLIAGAIWGFLALTPRRPPNFRDPSVLEVVFGSRVVVGGLRVAVLFAAAYVVVSVVALIARRQWLSRVGPVETSSRSVREADALNRQLTEQLRDALQTIEELKLELDLATDELLETQRQLQE